MDDDMTARMQVLESKLDAVHASLEKLRKYFFVTIIISITMVVLPLLGLVIVVPIMFNIFSATYDSLL